MGLRLNLHIFASSFFAVVFSSKRFSVGFNDLRKSAAATAALLLLPILAVDGPVVPTDLDPPVIIWLFSPP